MDPSTEELIEQLTELIPRRNIGGPGRNHSEGGSAAGAVMRCLARSEAGFSPGDLGRELGVTGPRITVILNDLEKRGQIQRTTAEEDRRSVVVTLTRDGRETVEQFNCRRRMRVTRLVEKIGPEDARALLRILQAAREMEAEDARRD